MVETAEGFAGTIFYADVSTKVWEKACSEKKGAPIFEWAWSISAHWRGVRCRRGNPLAAMMGDLLLTLFLGVKRMQVQQAIQAGR